MHTSKQTICAFTVLIFVVGTCFCSCHSCKAGTVVWSVPVLFALRSSSLVDSFNLFLFRDCFLFLGTDLRSSLEVLDSDVLSQEDWGLLDASGLESREKNVSLVLHRVVSVFVMSLVHSVVGVNSVVVV